MKIVWKMYTPKFGPDYPVGYVGKHRLFRICAILNLEEEVYYLHTNLYGVNSPVEVKTVDEGKTRAESMMTIWVSQLELDKATAASWKDGLLVVLRAVRRAAIRKAKDPHDDPFVNGVNMMVEEVEKHPL